MAAVTKTRTYATGGTLTASNYNDDRDEIIAGVNSIVNAQIATGAAIDPAKISGTAVTATGSETLTNKTLTTPTITNPTVTTGTFTNPTVTTGTFTKPTISGSAQSVTTDSDGATITFDMSASNIHTVTLGGNRTLAVSNTSVGQVFVIRLVQDGSGSRTVSWFSTIKWSGGTAPTLTTTASKTDSFGFICTSSGNYDGYILGQNL